jgi:hypothetical protein
LIATIKLTLCLVHARFEVEDWPPVREDLKNEALWDRSWEDDNVNDPIGSQLREALPKVQQQQQQEKEQQGGQK